MKKNLGIILVTLFLAFAGMQTVSAAQQTLGSLTDQQKSIVTIAAFTARGDLVNLETALNEGLDAGLTINKIKEVLIQMYAYCGFPRSLNAVNTFMSVVDERKIRGINDADGPEAKPIPKDIDKNEYGMLVRQKLFGRTSEAPPSGYQLFTPVLDDFLKEHLFADIFYRDTLDHLSREIATVAALAAMNGTNPQLQAHMNAAMITGLTEAQMKDLIKVIETRVGKEEGKNANNIFQQVINSRRN